MEGETDLVTELMDAAWQRILQVMRDTQSRLQLKETLCVGQKYASDHPVITLSILLTTTMCCVPIMCFVAFAVGSALLTFATFLCIEGFLLTCGCLVLSGSLFVLGFLSIGICTFLGVSWFVIGMSQRLLEISVTKLTEKFKSYRAEARVLDDIGAVNGECIKDSVSEKND
ncbi:hypothetical protein NP493_1061g00022 [Ridgeia piscesae]|uniref:Promethin n=1 Tax=Ridgeia piscesae TaxID=27915 RepID=A0AAD9NKD3_RIDPI|nr:hypothetical protein NP493_1061g00022 [Ridgeia piscesae]